MSCTERCKLRPKAFQSDVTCESNPSPSESLCALRLVEVCRGAGGERRLRVEIHSDKVYCFGDTNRPLVFVFVKLKFSTKARKLGSRTQARES